jgi:rhodanese-related sulfurtransferase
MTKLPLLLSLTLLVPSLVCADDYFQTIPMPEVARIMNKPGVVLLDVNVPEIWEKHHIPGAVHIDSADLAKYLPKDRSATLIFYCASPLCSASGAAANESVLLGYRKVYVMPEGISGWVRMGFPVVAQASGKHESMPGHMPEQMPGHMPEHVQEHEHMK